MSHYAYLEIAGYPVWEMRNVADPYMMQFFHQSDKVVYSRIREGEEERVQEYRVPVKRYATRLDVMGYSLLSAIDCFAGGVRALHEQMDLTQHELELFSRFDFDTWKDCMRIIIEHGLTQWDVEKRMPGLSLPSKTAEYISFILGSFKFEEAGHIPEYYFSGTFFLGFSLFSMPAQPHTGSPTADTGHVLRAVCDVVDQESLVQFDYSSLIDWGSYTEDEDITEAPEATVVLTEGSTDRLIIERTLRLLHPDLAKYFSFLDFQLPNLEGGASALVHLLKGFIAARIRNRIVAIFDNDTAAKDALHALRDVPLPANMRILTLPDLEIAREYPTQGPQGLLPVNINGLACGLELFLGRDVLSSQDGTLIPVHWKGYNNALQRYHGELLKKREVQAKYLALLDTLESGARITTGHDWSPMESLFAALFSAYCRPPTVPAT